VQKLKEIFSLQKKISIPGCHEKKKFPLSSPKKCAVTFMLPFCTISDLCLMAASIIISSSLLALGCGSVSVRRVAAVTY